MKQLFFTFRCIHLYTKKFIFCGGSVPGTPADNYGYSNLLFLPPSRTLRSSTWVQRPCVFICGLLWVSENEAQSHLKVTYGFCLWTQLELKCGLS